MSTALLSFVGWAFLPNLVTGWVQSLYYGLTIRAGDRRPQPGSPRHGNHRRRIHIIVILAYLLYTIYEAYHQMRMQGDFYQSLDVSHDVDDKGIKSRFRRLHVRTSLRWTPTNVVSRAALHHPDKVGASKSPAASEAYFVHLKLAQDTLLNPAKRFAYDRFGPDMLEWRHCTTIRDYIAAGFTAFAPSYLASGFLLVVLSVTGYLQWGRFWRYLTSTALVVLELYTLTRPYPTPLLAKGLNPVLIFLRTPPLLPFQLLVLARRATLAVLVALVQLGPLLANPAALAPSNPDVVQPAQLYRLEQIALATGAETTRLLALEMAPMAGDDAAVGELKGKVKEWLVQNTIRADPEVRDAVGKALGKRRVGAPAGAR